jgi:hypothetical protein
MEDIAVVPGTGEYGRIGGRERLFNLVVRGGRRREGEEHY